MSFDITIPGGQSRRLLTGGKYCPDDIVVTATGSGAVLPELSNPGSAGDLMAGKQLIDGDGVPVTGTFTIAPELAEQAALIDEIRMAVQSKAVAAPVIQALEITENGVYNAPEGVDGYSPITVNVAGAAPADPRDLYQRVEYITAAEEETYPFIITDFIADNDSGLEIVASFPKLQDRIPMGSRTDGESTRFYCTYPMSTTSFYYGFNGGYSISGSPKTDTIYRLQTNFLNSRMANVFDKDGIMVKSAAIASSIKLTQQTCPVSIFGYNRGDTGAIYSKREFKLCSARCSQGHEVVRHYVAVRRKSDGEVGVVDTLSWTFRGNDNPEGGAFVAGPDIDWEV